MKKLILIVIIILALIGIKILTSIVGFFPLEEIFLKSKIQGKYSALKKEASEINLDGKLSETESDIICNKISAGFTNLGIECYKTYEVIYVSNSPLDETIKQIFTTFEQNGWNYLNYGTGSDSEAIKFEINEFNKLNRPPSFFFDKNKFYAAIEIPNKTYSVVFSIFNYFIDNKYGDGGRQVESDRESGYFK